MAANVHEATKVLKRHHRRLLELRTASRRARLRDEQAGGDDSGGAPVGNALVGHIRVERELCSEIFSVEVAIAAAQDQDLASRLRLHEAEALATRSMKAANEATNQIGKLEAEHVAQVESLVDIIAHTPKDQLRLLQRQIGHALQDA
jgi:hypothetical protein